MGKMWNDTRHHKRFFSLTFHFFFYLQGRGTDTYTEKYAEIHLLLYSPDVCESQVGLRPKPGGRNFIWLSPMCVAGNQGPEYHLLPSGIEINWKLDWKQSSWAWNRDLQYRAWAFQVETKLLCQTPSPISLMGESSSFEGSLPIRGKAFIESLWISSY